MPINGMELQKEKKPFEIKVTQDAEDVSGNLDVKEKIGNPYDLQKKKRPSTDDDIVHEKKWVSDSLKKMEEEDEKRKKEEKARRERSKNLQEQDEKERLKLFVEDAIDISKDRLEVKVPLKTVLDFSYGKKFNDRIDKSKRQKAQNNKNSRLYHKLVTAKALEDKLSDIYETQFARCNEMAKEVKGNIDSFDFSDLCSFMGKDKFKNIDLLKLFLGGRDENDNPQTDEFHARLALVEMANQILGFNFDGIALNTDNDIVASADKLETMSVQVAAFERLSSKYKLFENIDPAKVSAIESKLTSLRPLLTYYSIRKQIIGNKEYKNHYNDELSMDISGAKTKEQKELAKLLMSSYVVGKNMFIASKNTKQAEKMKNLQFKNTSANEAYNQIVNEFALNNQKNYSKELKDNYTSTESLGALALQMKQAGINEEVKIDAPIENNVQARAHSQKLNAYSYIEAPLRSMLTSDELIPLKGTREMATLKKNIAAISAFASNTMPPIKLDAQGNIDKENEKKVQGEIDAVCTTMVMLYSKLTDSIDKFIKKYGSAYTELSEMLTELSKSVAEERESFRQKTIEYREVVSIDQQLSKKPITVLDTIRYNRGAFYDLDNDKKLTVEVGGAVSSIVYKITRQVPKTKENPEGKEIVYFREKDKVPSENNMDLVDSALAGFELSEKLKETLADALDNISNNYNKTMILFSHLNKYKADKETTIEEKIKVLKRDINDMTDKTLNISENEYEAVWNAFLKYQHLMTSREIASQMEISPKIKCGKNLSDRNVATSRLATLLGMQAMICDSRTATIRMNGKLVKGNLMDNTGGSSTSKKNVAYSPEAIAQIFQMQVFDFICGQTDRHFENFHGVIENGKFTQIRCLDNDLAFGRLKAADIDGKYFNRIKPVDTIAISGLSASFINKIMAMDRPYMEQILGDIIDAEEMDALMDRLNCVKNHIVNYAKNHKAVAEWDSEKKLFSFKGETKDDQLRQILAVKAYVNRADQNYVELENICCFFRKNIELTDLDSMEKKRRRELGNAGKK